MKKTTITTKDNTIQYNNKNMTQKIKINLNPTKPNKTQPNSKKYNTKQHNTKKM